MTKNRTDPKSFYYQQTHKGSNYQLRDYWQPGDILSEEDEALLTDVKVFYRDRQYSPSQRDMEQETVKVLKNRFRTWKNVLIAAGLPALNDPDMQTVRQRKMKDAEC